jgi:hypothetical protein
MRRNLGEPRRLGCTVYPLKVLNLLAPGLLGSKAETYLLFEQQFGYCYPTGRNCDFDIIEDSIDALL